MEKMYYIVIGIIVILLVVKLVGYAIDTMQTHGVGDAFDLLPINDRRRVREEYAHEVKDYAPSTPEFRLAQEEFNMPSPNMHIKGRKRGKSTIKYDTAKFTVSDFDTVIEYHDAWKECNEGITPKELAYVTKRTLTSMLNDKLSLNKSQSAYARIWNGVDKRQNMRPNATLI